MLKCSHNYDLVQENKENVKYGTYALENIRMIFVILSLCNVMISSVSGKKVTKIKIKTHGIFSVSFQAL